MSTDAIADMLTKIRNAQAVKHATVTVPRIKIIESIAQVLQREGYLADMQSEETAIPATLTLTLKYAKDGTPAIRRLTRKSSPGRRDYRGHGTIPRVKRGLGLAIISTSQGVMTDREARKRGIGGELLCTVW